MTNTHTMLHGDCMSLMSTMPEASYDAVITDPPYASGGLSTAARAQDPRVKYQLSGTHKYYPTFSNDTRDQRTHLMWSVRWMEQALRLGPARLGTACLTDIPTRPLQHPCRGLFLAVIRDGKKLW